MARVFTVYNCGTGFDRTHTEELIANLATITLGSENRDWMITDGVGGSPVKFNRLTATPQQAALHDAAKLPGSRSAVKTTQQGYSTLKNGANRAGGRFPWLRGIVTGHGWEHNVDHAMDVIVSLIMGSNTPPEVINLAGWSRGAITCIMLAHALYDEPATRSIPVHIFAADPVAGPGNRVDIDKNTLSPNVRRYLGIMQQHEMRGLFTPTVMKPLAMKGLDMKDKILPMPGVHNTGVISLKSEVGLITASIAHKFLMKHGTQLRNPIVLASRDLCELYAKVRLEFKQYKKMGQSLSQWAQRVGGLHTHQRQDLAYQKAGAGTSVDYFINDHHIQQFREVFPVNCQRLLGHPFNMRTSQDELRRMRNYAPTTYRSLEAINAIC